MNILIKTTIQEIQDAYIDSDSFGYLIGISSWQSFLCFSFILISTIILIWFTLKRKKDLYKAVIVFIVIGSLLFYFLTRYAGNNQQIVDAVHQLGGIVWEDQVYDWWMLYTSIFLGIIIIVIPIFIFVTIIRTVNINRHLNKVNSSLIWKSFFIIWLMPFIAITVALLMVPLINLIDLPSQTGYYSTGEDVDNSIVGTINNAIPNSLAIFTSIEAILAVVFISFFIGFVLNYLHRKDHDRAEKFFKFNDGALQIINKYISNVIVLVPFVLVTRIPLLFNYQFLKANAIGLLTFFIVFLIGLIIVTAIEIFLMFLFRVNKNQKVFNNVLKTQFANSIIKHSSFVLLPDTIANSKKLYIQDEVATTTPTMSSSMGMSICGGFYPAFIALMTANLAGVQITLSFILIMYISIMITNLGMTGVPGADLAVIISVLGALQLPIGYFATVYVLDGFIDRLRGIGNSFGFLAATTITNRFNDTEKLKGRTISITTY